MTLKGNVMTIDNLKLYEINEQLRHVLEHINEIAEQNEGEIHSSWGQLLDKLSLSKETKILDIARYIKSLRGQAEAIKGEIDRLETRHKSYKNHIERLINYLTWNMGPDEKYKDNNTTIGWRKSSRVDIKDPSKLPNIYLQTEVTVLKSLIKKNLKEGINIDGAEIIQSYTISIK